MITSTSNERVKWIRSLQARRRNRDNERRFVAEGVRWAEEFVAAQRTPELVLHTEELDQRERTALGRLTAMGAEELQVSPEVMAACSDTESPQRLLLVAAQPDISPPSPSDWLMVADGLSDPGNLGTLLRTALAAGVDALLLVKGSVDPYNPKVVRGAMGAQLRLPIELVERQALSARLQGHRALLAEARAGDPYTQVDWRGPIALIIGSEAHGPSDDLRALAHGSTHIPIESQADSLNAAVAAAVILFEIRRQRGAV